MSQERTDAQLEQWCNEIRFFVTNPPPRIADMPRTKYGPGQEAIDRQVSAWLIREHRALEFRRILYGQT